MTEKKMIVDIPDGAALSNAADRPGWSRGITHDSDQIGAHVHLRELTPEDEQPDSTSPRVNFAVAATTLVAGAAAMWGYQRFQDWRARRRMPPVVPLTVVSPLSAEQDNDAA